MMKLNLNFVTGRRGNKLNIYLCPRFSYNGGKFFQNPTQIVTFGCCWLCFIFDIIFYPKRFKNVYSGSDFASNIQMNLQSCCHRCKVRIFHLRGEEKKTLLPFYQKHYACMKLNPNNIETLEDQI